MYDAGLYTLRPNKFVSEVKFVGTFNFPLLIFFFHVQFLAVFNFLLWPSILVSNYLLHAS